MAHRGSLVRSPAPDSPPPEKRCNCLAQESNQNKSTAETLEEEWEEFKRRFCKKYNEREDIVHKRVFRKTMKEMRKLNREFRKNICGYEAVYNEMADLEMEERCRVRLCDIDNNNN